VAGAGAATRLEVFAVDVDMVQVCWSDLPRGAHALEIDGTRRRTVEGGGPGSAIVDSLRPGAEVRVALAGTEAPVVRTLSPPPGRELSRIATISDLHFGERRFGRWPRIKPGVEWRDAAEPYPVACTRAALREAVAWGAQLIVVKGDLTDEDLDEDYEALGEVLATVPVPVMVIPGNHDGGDRSRGDGASVLARHGIDLITDVRVEDVPGLRVVVASSREVGKHRGNLTPFLLEITEALSTAPGGALLATHHPPFRTVVTPIWPPGILGLDGWRLLQAVDRAHSATLVTGGHTHRNRRRSYHSIPITEVGAPKDFPGVWAGYVAHEGGIRQVVRRVADPQVITWTERCAGTLGGWWRYWSRGSLEARCFSHTWP
jgi:3',5'-cyclic AMP phosphodiesterase CpdA